MIRSAILDGITGDELWIKQCLSRLDGTGELLEMATNRVAILEALGFIERTNDIGTEYKITEAGKEKTR